MLECYVLSWGFKALLKCEKQCFGKYTVCIYLLTPWCRVLLEKLTGLQLVKKFPAFHRTRRFITALTSLRHPSLSWASPIESIISSPFVFCVMPPLETLPPPGDPSGGVVYLRIVLFPEQASCMWVFLNSAVLQGGIVSPSPNPHAGGPPLVGCPRLLIQFIRSCRLYRRPFLYPQPEDAPCRGDRDPLILYVLHYLNYTSQINSELARPLPCTNMRRSEIWVGICMSLHFLHYFRTFQSSGIRWWRPASIGAKDFW